MELAGERGTALTLDILSYEFGDNQDDEHDANWLMVHMRVTDPRGGWSTTAPMLLTWEVARFADWLAALAAGEPAAPTVGFLEPNLFFAARTREPDQVTIRVTFEQECRPPWHPSRFGLDGTPAAQCNFCVAPPALGQAAAALRAALVRFPPRAGK